MAKQNVTFIERHVEKIVVGVAGAALLGIAVLYLIGTPHKVELDGAKLGPKQFYTQLRDRAEQARNRMKDVQPEQDIPDDGLSIQVADSDAQRSPYDYLQLPKVIVGTFAPLGPAVPEVGRGSARGQIRLADILPPEPVLVTASRAFVKLGEPQTIVPGDKSTRSEAGQLGVTRDQHWVTVIAAVHRKDQRDQFDEAQYAPERQRLIVAAVEAERQQRMPDGGWGKPVLVSGYSPRVVPVLDSVELVQQDDDGEHRIYDQDMEYIEDYRALLDTPEGQDMILRPAFQEYLEYPYDWVVPKELPGVDIELTEPPYNVLLPPDEESDESGPGARGRGRDRPAGSTAAVRSARAQINQLFKEAKEAINEEEYIEAGDLLQEIIDHSDATLKQIENAQSELRGIQAAIDQAVNKQEREAEKQAQAAKQQLGEDIEPLWLNDLSVTPGAIYRYRLRLLAYNRYVGWASKLERLEDAAKVVTAGKWSEWSEPVQVKQALYLFLASAKDNPKRAKLEMREWTLGTWHPGGQELGVGEPISFNAGRYDFTYNAIVVDVADGVSYQERLVSRAGEISYRPKETAAIVLITSDGEVEERIAAVDHRRKQQLVRANNDYRKERAKYEGTDRLRPQEKKRQPQRPAQPVPGREHFEDDLEMLEGL